MKVSQSPVQLSMRQDGRSRNTPAHQAKLTGAEVEKAKGVTVRTGPRTGAGSAAKGADPASILAAQIASGPPRVDALDAWGEVLAFSNTVQYR